MARQRQVHPTTHDYLQQRGVSMHVAQTREAVKIYNELAERGLVAGLFHSACWHPLPSARPPGQRAAC